MPRRQDLPEPHVLAPLERQVIDFFVDGVRVLGLPPSLGEIYGLLYISRDPLSLDDVVHTLNISKGSASQGLRALKGLGAVREAITANGDRKTYYEAAVELKRLVGGFIREQIRPHLESGRTKLADLARTAETVSDPSRREFLDDRISRIDQWVRRGGQILPMIQKILGE
ncbi:MAG: transcriptional regulator [Verrucomicrobiota bacterium]